MTNTLGAKPVINTSEFKKAIGDMNSELRVLESGFRATAAGMQDWTKDATGLEARAKSLNSQIDIQRQKVEATRDEWERTKQAHGENSRSANKLEEDLNKATQKLNEMELELKQNNTSLVDLAENEDEAGDSAEEMGNDIEESGSKFETFKSILGGGLAVFSGLVTGILAVGATAVATVGLISGLVLTTADLSAEIVDLSTKTGIEVERLQELDYIADQVGTSLETITGAQARLVRSMNEGRDGIGSQADAFKALGVSVTDADGNLRNTQDVFAETIDALSRIENPAEADALAMQLFGKSAQELNPLIRAGSDELARLAEEAHNVGAVVAEEDVRAFEAFDDTLASLQAGLQGTLGTLASAFLPTFQSVFDQAGGYLQEFKDIVSGSDGDIGKIAEGLTGLVAQIATDVAQQAPAMLEAGLGIVESILDAITQALPSLLDAATAILESLIGFIVKSLPTLLNSGVSIILTLVDAIVANLPLLVDAALQAIIALAVGLSGALPELIPAIAEAINLIVAVLIENLPLLIDAAGLLILALADGLIAAMPYLTEIVVGGELNNQLIQALLALVPKILSIGWELILALSRGIVDNIPAETLKVVSTFIENMLFKFATNAIKIASIGKNFISGIIDGLKSAEGFLYDAILGIITNMLAVVTGSAGLDQQSPSRKGRAAGRNYAGSLAIGGMDMMRDVERAFVAITGRMTSAVASGLSSTSTVNTNSNNSNRVMVVGDVNVNGDAPAGSLADELKRPRY